MNKTGQTVIKVLLGAVALALMAGLALTIALQPSAAATNTALAAPQAQISTPTAAPTATATPKAAETTKAAVQPKVGDKAAAMAEMQQYLTPILEAVTKTLNLTQQQLMAAFISGQSLADIAKAQQVPLSTVQTAVVDTVKSQLDQFVKDGKITAAQQQKVVDTANLWFEDFANFSSKDISKYSNLNLNPQQYAQPVYEAAAKTLNLTTDQLTAQFQAGKSLADIAKAQGVAVADVKTKTLAEFKNQLTSLAGATNGAVTTAQVDKAVKTADIWFDEFVTAHK